MGGISYNAEFAEKPVVANVGTSPPPTRSGGRSGLEEFERLPESQKEVLKIESIFERTMGDQAKFWTVTGKDATKARFFELAGKAQFIHLATHGYCETTDRPSVANAR